MSIPRRLGRLARGFVSTLQDDDRFRETLRTGRERGETLRDAFGGAFSAAWRGAAEEWQAAEQRHAEERTAHEQAAEEHASRKQSAQEQSSESQASGRASDRRERSWRSGASGFVPRKYPLNVLSAYNRLGLNPGAPMEEVHRKRRELVKRFHPDRFTDPGKRAKAERLTAEINGAHDAIIRHSRR
ncbi:MAG: J domain-containing protein [Rubrobacteraceae bacterium]|nr:J domain-containing protein [Rubrobacter sp.]